MTDRVPWQVDAYLDLARREHAIGEFTADEYLAVQRVVHRVGRALSGLLAS
ncbi:hypothetical protein [Amycolatopsis japonica]|uniref:hypothetical protein n=1 Tax=Amycolatopsis japonica TaxID=208439 RepID=UPI0037F7F3B9